MHAEKQRNDEKMQWKMETYKQEETNTYNWVEIK